MLLYNVMYITVYSTVDSYETPCYSCCQNFFLYKIDIHLLPLPLIVGHYRCRHSTFVYDGTSTSVYILVIYQYMRPVSHISHIT